MTPERCRRRRRAAPRVSSLVKGYVLVGAYRGKVGLVLFLVFEQTLSFDSYQQSTKTEIISTVHQSPIILKATRAVKHKSEQRKQRCGGAGRMETVGRGGGGHASLGDITFSHCGNNNAIHQSLVLLLGV